MAGAAMGRPKTFALRDPRRIRQPLFTMAPSVSSLVSAADRTGADAEVRSQQRFPGVQFAVVGSDRRSQATLTLERSGR